MVLALLGSVLFLTSAPLIEIVASLAVFFSFAHMKVSNRLEEREAYRIKNNTADSFSVSYSHKITRYLYIKEFLWIVYFVLIGAWSALVGAFVFLLYPSWRRLWRKYHPLEKKMESNK